MESNILEKINLHIASFQEGFQILSNVNSLELLVEKFKHILRGNLLTTGVDLYYKGHDTDCFINVSSKNEIDAQYYLNKESIKKNLPFHQREKDFIISFIPLVDKSSFLIITKKKLDGSLLNDEEIIILQIFLQLLDNAYQAFTARQKEKELLFNLNQKVLQLNNLIDAGIELSKLQEEEVMLKMAIEKACTLTNSSYGFIDIIIGESFKKICFPFQFDDEFTKSTNNSLKEEFDYKNIKYVFCLLDKESRHGTEEYQIEDKLLLSSIVRQVFRSIENSWLHKDALEKESIKRELAVAAEIQQKIIPTELPPIENFEIGGINIPSKEVGGDYYDCIKIAEDKYAMIMADVSGKGVPASLLVNTLNAALNSYLDTDFTLLELLPKLNSIIFKASPSDKYITFVIAILDVKSNKLDLINAGHNPPMILRENNTIEEIPSGGLSLGMFDMGLPFEAQTVQINPKEVVLFFTDGVTEAMNEVEEEYSEERLEKFIKENHKNNCDDFMQDLVKDIKVFAGSAEQSDDITALLLKAN